MHTGEKSIIAACILYHSNMYTKSAFICTNMMLWLFTKFNSKFNSSTLSRLLHLIYMII